MVGATSRRTRREQSALIEAKFESFCEIRTIVEAEFGAF
jgi:hypothetical protein